MIRKNSTISNLGLFTVLFLVVVFALYGSQIALWQHQFPGGGEDGAKNYFTAAYHIEHDQSLTWFDGMNYPWGEHVIYTDNQPLISNTIKLFGGSAQIIPYLILLSAWLGGWLLFRIIATETKTRWFALLSSLGIIFLSPQFERFGGHYSLAYVGLIPVFLYLIWKRKSTYALRINLSTFLVVFFTGWIHPYLMMMMAVFWICLNGVEFLLSKPRELNKIFSLVLWPVLPILLFRILIWWTDPVMDRPDEPFGFLVFRATWASIFLPVDHRYFQLLNFAIPVPKEGGFYIGAVAVIISLVALFRVKKFDHQQRHHMVFVASLPLLLIALAFPFYLPKLDRLLPLLGPLQQFRGIGRFAFVFFFAINLFAFIEIGRWLQKRDSKIARFALIIPLLLLSFDVYTFTNRVLTKSKVGVPHFEGSMTEINSENYQCILPLPYFHIGSEWLRGEEHLGWKEMNFNLSYATGLPLVAVQLSRASTQQTLLHKQLTTFFTSRPSVLELYTNQPILISHNENYPINSYERDLLYHARPIKVDNNSGVSLYEMKLGVIDSIAARNWRWIMTDTSMRIRDDFDLVYHSFDDSITEYSFSGKGAQRLERIDWTNIFPQEIILESDSEYELSFWWKAEKQEQLNTQLWIWQLDDTTEVDFQVSQVSDHIEQVIGDWVLCTIPITVQSTGNSIDMLVHRDGKNTTLWVDEIVLRNTDDHYFRPNDSSLNNRYLSSFLSPINK